MPSCVLWVVCPKDNLSSLVSFIPLTRTTRRPFPFLSSGGGGGGNLRLRTTRVRAVSSAVANPISSEEKVYEVVLKQSALVREQRVKVKEERKEAVKGGETADGGLSSWNLLNEAYDRCGEVCAEYAKTFYLDGGFGGPPLPD